MQIFITHEVDKALSRKLFKLYSKEQIKAVDRKEFNLPLVQLIEDVIFDPSIIDIIYNDQQMEEELFNIWNGYKKQIQLE